MTLPATNQPLTDQEFERLADFLGRIGPAAMNIETLDGYFAALIATSRRLKFLAPSSRPRETSSGFGQKRQGCMRMTNQTSRLRARVVRWSADQNPSSR